jgi:hypothetical protein
LVPRTPGTSSFGFPGAKLRIEVRSRTPPTISTGLEPSMLRVALITGVGAPRYESEVELPPAS